MGLIGEHSVEIRARTEGEDTSGAKNRTWASSGATFACTVQPASTRDVTEAMQQGYEVSHRIFFTSNPNSNSGDLILYGTLRLYQKGKTIHRDESAALEHWKVLASEKEHRQAET